MTTDPPTVVLTGEAMVPLVRAAGVLTSADLPPRSSSSAVMASYRSSFESLAAEAFVHRLDRAS